MLWPLFLVGVNWQDSKFLGEAFNQDRRKNSNGSEHEHRIFSIALPKLGCIHRGASEPSTILPVFPKVIEPSLEHCGLCHFPYVSPNILTSPDIVAF